MFNLGLNLMGGVRNVSLLTHPLANRILFIDGIGGSAITDGYDYTLSSDVTVVDQVFEFNSQSANPATGVNYGDILQYPAGGMTVTVIANADNWTGSDGANQIQGLVGCIEASGTDGRWGLYLLSGSLSGSVDTGGNRTVSKTISGTLTNGQTHALSWTTLNETSATDKLYVDSAEVATLTQTAQALPTTLLPLKIGSYDERASNAYAGRFLGKIYNVIIHSGQLTPAEITEVHDFYLGVAALPSPPLFEGLNPNNPSFAETFAVPNAVVGTTLNIAVSDFLEVGKDAPDSYVLHGQLPTGTALNSSTGDITGEITATGSFSFYVQGLYAAGAGITTNSVAVVVIDPTAITAGSIDLPIAIVGQKYEYLLSEYFDGTPTLYELESGVLTDGATLNAYTGMLTLTATTTGTMTGLSFTASNNLGGVTTNTSDLVVSSALQPTFAGTFAPTDVITGVYYEYDASVFFTNADSYEVGRSKLPAGMWINRTTGLIYGTRTDDEPVTITVIGMSSAGIAESNAGVLA